MKSPDDNVSRKARLVREHCDAFMADDSDLYGKTAAELRAFLAAEAAELDRQIEVQREVNRGLERLVATLRDIEGDTP